MPNETLVLFPDTNLFIQCHPLGQLDWSDWKGFSEIHLIVCRPVQREIDGQKNRGNDRVGRRARETHSMFQKVIDSNEEYLLIRPSNPVVKLYLQGLILRSSDLDAILDYSKPDDELVGCLYRFYQDNPGEDARLLTHDGGANDDRSIPEITVCPHQK